MWFGVSRTPPYHNFLETYEAGGGVKASVAGNLRITRPGIVGLAASQAADARDRTVRHPMQNSKLDRQAQSAPGPLTDDLENATTFGGVVPRNLAFR